MKKPDAQYPIDKRVAHRLKRLERLIDTEHDGSTKIFQDRTGIKMAQVSQWFTGYRALRDKALSRLQEKTGKPEGWFDWDDDAAVGRSSQVHSQPPVRQAGNTGSKVGAAGVMTIERAEQEAELRPPPSPRDYQTIAQSLAEALKEKGIEMPADKFVELVDALHKKMSRIGE